MLRRSSFWFIVACLYSTVTSSREGFRSDDLHRMRSVGEVAISPDGGAVVYTIRHRDRPGRPHSTGWIRALDPEAEAGPRDGHRLFDGTMSEPHWSPDGKWIAFLGSRGDEKGLFVISGNRGSALFLAPVRATNHPLPSTGDRLSWSPDSRSIAYVSATPGPETRDAMADPVVITRYLYKPTAAEGSTRFNDNRRVHLFVVEMATKEVRQLTEGDAYEHSVDWSPDGEEILFVSNREPDPDRFFNYDVFAIGVKDGIERRLTRTENAEYRPSWSPDGRTIAYEATQRGLTSSETTMEDTHIWLMASDGSNRRELGASVDNRQRSPAWAADGSAVYSTVQERGYRRLYRFPVDGGSPEVVVSDMGGRRVSYSMATDGTIAYATRSRGDMAQLYVKRPGRPAGQRSDLNRELLEQREVAPVEAFTFLSFDGTEVEAFLTRPLQQASTTTHPLITIIKGGPHSQQGPLFHHTAQVYAARGWASLMVNYRGSTGYGQAFADAIFGDQNGGEAKDILYGVQAAVRRHRWLDRKRLGIQGGSYGGQLTNWIITQTSRFTAAIPMYGISNLISFNYMAYYHDYLAVEFGGYPHQDGLMDELWKRSPLKHVAKVTTPTLLVHGENDNDVPIAESEQYYIALKDVGVETMMVRYPREGHGIRESAHVVDLIERSIAWYEAHFSPGTSADLYHRGELTTALRAKSRPTVCR